MANNINIVLPVYNGETYVGLSAASDLSLPERKQLAYIAMENVKRSALATVAACLGHLDGGVDNEVKNLIANAAYAIVYHGLTGWIGPKKDRRKASDWVEVGNTAADFTQPLSDDATARITPEGISRALSVICATKLKRWNSNHHIGQGGF
jgi:hypothetical protein